MQVARRPAAIGRLVQRRFLSILIGRVTQFVIHVSWSPFFLAVKMISRNLAASSIRCQKTLAQVSHKPSSEGWRKCKFSSSKVGRPIHYSRAGIAYRITSRISPITLLIYEIAALMCNLLRGRVCTNIALRPLAGGSLILCNFAKARWY